MRNIIVTVNLLFVVAGLMTCSIFGQAPETGARFEAATIKPNNSVSNGIGNRYGPELFSWTNVPLRLFIENIYGMKDYQIIGAPNWMNTDKWDIVARSNGPSDFKQKYEMAKTLIAERFRLKFHWETRELPVYSLVALKGGPKFQQPKDDDLPAGIRPAAGLLTAHKWDVSSLPFWLSSQLNIPVVDKAGLKGVYDFELRWSPVPNEGNFPTRNDAVDPPPPPDQSGPTIFTALQEQLGLKLESSKGPVDVLVIDSVSKPSEN